MLKIFSIVPFNRMSADDFSYGGTVRDQGFINSQINWYRGWSGRYTSTLLQTTFGHVSGEWFEGKSGAYSLLTFTIVIFSFYLFFLRIVSVPQLDSLIASLFSLVVLYCVIPNKMESWYWMSGSITYLWPIVFTLLAVSVKSKYLSFALALLAGGGSETFIILALSIYSGLYFFSERNKKYLYLAIATLFSMFIVYLSPGNQIRAAGGGSDSMNIVGALLYSIQEGPKLLFKHVTNNLVYLLAAVLVFGYILRDDKSIKINYEKYFYLFAATVLISILYVFPAFKTLGRLPPDRSDISLVFILLLAMLLTGKLLSRYINKINLIYILSCFTIFSIGFLIVTSLGTDFYIARNYSVKFDQMITSLKTPNENIVIVDKLPESGLVPNAQIKGYDDWINRAVANFYEKEGIIAK